MNSRPWRMVALLGLVAPGWRQRAPSASGFGSGQLQPWGPSTWVQLAAWLNASATLPLRADAGRLGRGGGVRGGWCLLRPPPRPGGGGEGARGGREGGGGGPAPPPPSRGD